MPLLHLHPVTTVKVYVAAKAEDEGVEGVAPQATPAFVVDMAVSMQGAEVVSTPAGARQVREGVKLFSKDRTHLLVPGNVVELDMPDGRVAVRFVVESAKSSLRETQQVRATRAVAA